MSNKEQFLLTEKYRPKTVDECILPDRLKIPFKQYVAEKEIPTLLLTGTPGVGKTTIAKAMCEEIGCSYILINSSDERGIDTLRTKVKTYASTSSLSGKRKVVIMDEADYLTPDAQAAMRGIIEEFSSNCTFIFTCNLKSKIMDAIESRSIVVDFKLKAGEKTEMATQFFKRILYILRQEKIDFVPEAIAEIVKANFPDYRKTLNVIQHLSKFGKIDAGALVHLNSLNDVKDLFLYLKEKSFTKMRKWVVQNSDVDSSSMYRKIYEGLEKYVKEITIPLGIIILAKYQYQAAFCADQELNTMACLTELMMELEFA